MKKPIVSALAVLLSLAAFSFTHPLHAAEKERKVALQISDADPERQGLVLNVANNLQQHYGVDKVKIEVVAFGPGLRLLFKDNANKDRIAGLIGRGVRFSACENTVKAMTQQLGRAPDINDRAVRVSAGIGRIMELTEQGYTLVRP
jgi:intracellular sulfur oxidation DsrE/DsrF family protein